MKVRQVMKTRVITITPESTYADAARLMRENGFSGLPVVKDGRLVGVVSEKDLFKAIYPNYEDFAREPEAYLNQEEQESEIETVRQLPVVNYMTHNVLTIDPEAAVMRAGGIMLSHGIHRLPVVENGKLVGIVTRREIYGALLERWLGEEPEGRENRSIESSIVLPR